MNETLTSVEVTDSVDTEANEAIPKINDKRNQWLLSKIYIWLHKFVWMLSRSFCLILLVFLSSQLFLQYVENNPTTIATYTDHHKNSTTVKLKICHTVYLDPDKILGYNGSEIDIEAYEFLYEAVKGNSHFNDSGWVLTDHLKPFFSISSRVRKTFLTQLNQFMIACFHKERYLDCSNFFIYYDESYNPCFEGWVTLDGLGLHYAATIFLYFDPAKTLGKYTKSIGANVVLAHPEQHKPHIYGSFIAPGDLLTLSGSFVFKKQAKSFKKSKCVQRQGMETHNFTGEVFETSYNTHSCGELCLAKLYFEVCGCPALSGWNITKTECLEKSVYRRCITNQTVFEQNAKKVESCLQQYCWTSCNEKRIDVETKRAPLNFRRGGMITLLEGIISQAPNSSVLAASMLDKINGSASEEKQVSQNVAQLSVFLLDNQLITNLEIVEMVSFPTFIGNLGGLLGMWLGVSVVSVMQFLESWLRKMLHKIRFQCAESSAKWKLQMVHPVN